MRLLDGPRSVPWFTPARHPIFPAPVREAAWSVMLVAVRLVRGVGQGMPHPSPTTTPLHNKKDPPTSTHHRMTNTSYDFMGCRPARPARPRPRPRPRRQVAGVMACPSRSCLPSSGSSSSASCSGHTGRTPVAPPSMVAAGGSAGARGRSWLQGPRWLTLQLPVAPQQRVNHQSQTPLCLCKRYPLSEGGGCPAHCIPRQMMTAPVTIRPPFLIIIE